MTLTRSVVKRGLAVAAVLAAAGSAAVALRLRATVRRALAPVPARDGSAAVPRRAGRRPSAPALGRQRGGGGGAHAPGAAGRRRVRREPAAWRNAVGLGGALPGLAVGALTLWRGEPVVAPKQGGLFVRRDGRWEEARTGWGTLDVRALGGDRGRRAAGRRPAGPLPRRLGRDDARAARRAARALHRRQRGRRCWREARRACSASTPAACRAW